MLLIFFSWQKPNFLKEVCCHKFVYLIQKKKKKSNKLLLFFDKAAISFCFYWTSFNFEPLIKKQFCVLWVALYKEICLWIFIGIESSLATVAAAASDNTNVSDNNNNHQPYSNDDKDDEDEFNGMSNDDIDGELKLC